MAMTMGALKRLDMIRTMPELREKLWTVVNALQNGLKEAGFDLGKTNTQVTPVYMKGGEEEATQMIYDLRENYGIFCSIVVYPGNSKRRDLAAFNSNSHAHAGRC